jgi:COMPASS component SWD3
LTLSSSSLLQHTLVRQFSGHTSYVFCVNFHPNTSLAVSGSFDESVRLWNLQRNTCHRVISAHSEAVTAVDFNIDGSILASSSYDGQIRLWDSTTGQCIKTLLSEGEKKSIGIGDVKFSPNSFQILATSLDHTIRLWDIANSRVVKTYLGHQNEKFAIKACFSAFNHTSRSSSHQDQSLTTPPLMIVAGSENNRIHLWDLQSRKVMQTLIGHKDVVTSIATHPSKHVIVSASLDRDPTVRVSN